MTIAESWTKPIAQTAARAFVHPYNPDKPSLQVIFHDHWDDFCDWIEEHPEIVLRKVVYDEVDKLMACDSRSIIGMRKRQSCPEGLSCLFVYDIRPQNDRNPKTLIGYSGMKSAAVKGSPIDF